MTTRCKSAIDDIVGPKKDQSLFESSLTVCEAIWARTHATWLLLKWILNWLPERRYPVAKVQFWQTFLLKLRKQKYMMSHGLWSFFNGFCNRPHIEVAHSLTIRSPRDIQGTSDWLEHSDLFLGCLNWRQSSRKSPSSSGYWINKTKGFSESLLTTVGSKIQDKMNVCVHLQ